MISRIARLDKKRGNGDDGNKADKLVRLEKYQANCISPEPGDAANISAVFAYNRQCAPELQSLMRNLGLEAGEDVKHTRHVPLLKRGG